MKRNNYISDDLKQTTIQNAIKFWEDNTCVKFEYEGEGDDSLKFISGAGCYSNIGRVGGQQEVSIGDGCEYV